MKMRKILPLIILAVGSFFLLSGCDAMLDAIFATNQITVDVAVTIPPYPSVARYYYDWAYGVGAVTLTFTDINTGAVTVVTSGRTGYDAVSSHFVFPFTKLKGDIYTIAAVYSSVYYPPYTYGTSTFYDPSGVPLGSISMPYTNSGDSTGHSVHLFMYF